jgi:hypothetical protein
VSYKPGSYSQYLQSYVRNWKRTTMNCARIMHAATGIRDNSVNLRRATCAVHKHADKCIKAEGGIFENVL